MTVLAAGLTASGAPAAAALQDDGELAVVAEVNAVRAAHRLPRVRPKAALARAATAHSAALLRAGTVSHTSPDGTSFTRRLRSYTRARSVGEVIAATAAFGRTRATVIVNAWMRSPSHRAVLLDPRFTRMGVGAITGRAGGMRRTVVTADFSTAR